MSGAGSPFRRYDRKAGLTFGESAGSGLTEHYWPLLIV